MKIGHTEVSRSAPPVIVAELSGNHNGSLERALSIVDAIAKSGAQALKLQTYRPDTMTIDVMEDDFRVMDAGSLWRGESLWSLYEKAHTPWEWHGPIFERARSLGLVCYSTPFDETAVRFLEELGAPAYKIASFENVDLALIRRVAATGKPVVISTGLATLAEVDEAVRTVREAGCKDLVLLKCTSSYPASPTSSNLAALGPMREMFGCEVGLSDHTLGIGAAVASVALGSTMIEKHVTLDRNDGGVDSKFSLEPAELEQLVKETKAAWQAIGSARFGRTEEEARSVVFRRSLYICEDLRAGDVLTPDALRAIRPGHGLAPKYLETLLGKKVNRDVRRGTRFSWDLIG